MVDKNDCCLLFASHTYPKRRKESVKCGVRNGVSKGVFHVMPKKMLHMECVVMMPSWGWQVN
jgi:hypothetical protein